MKLRFKYQIGLATVVSKLAEQNNASAVCRRADLELVVDHCHKLGEFRGMLCRQCNVMLGGARDVPSVLRAGADYLESFLAKGGA